MKKAIRAISVLVALVMVMASFLACNNGNGPPLPPDGREISFTYNEPTANHTPTNIQYVRPGIESVSNFDEVIINPVTGAREDFIKGVDASMIEKMESLTGANAAHFYNDDGFRQDIFQILADHGVNFFRVRIFNQPFATIPQADWGGGGVTVARAINMARRARAVGMNIFVAFHYSDIWADTEHQITPRAWINDTKAQLPGRVEDWTYNSLQQFNTAGVPVDIVQIGNEINFGMFYGRGVAADRSYRIEWGTPDAERQTFDELAEVLKRGISGARRAMPDIYTAIHLSNGGLGDNFERFFEHLERNSVDYDIIAASFFSHLDGELELLQDTLDRVSEKFGKHVLVAETSYAHSLENHHHAQNSFTNHPLVRHEERGGYVASAQGQASNLRDVMQTVANVPDDRGLGVFYWEPAWLPRSGATVDISRRRNNLQDFLLSQHANQGLFSYGGRVLPSMRAFEAVNASWTVAEEQFVGVRHSAVSVVLNIAEEEVMPLTHAVTTDQGRFVERDITWRAEDLPQLANLGTGYTVRGTVEGLEVTATVDVIQNFVRDPSFEGQISGVGVTAPWNAQWTPADRTVIQIERQNNPRTGRANLNWWNNGAFEMTVWQDITGLEDGTYTLSAWAQGISQQTDPHTELFIFARDLSGNEIARQNIAMTGWAQWINPSVTFEVTGGSVRIGLRARATEPNRWGHIDDFLLIRVS